MLFECGGVSEVWKQVFPHKANISGKASNFKDWYSSVMETETEKTVELTAIIAWLIWKRRNEKVFEGIDRGTKNMINYGQSFLKEYQVAQSKPVKGLEAVHNQWKPPGEGLLKLNVDAAFKESNAGLGVVVRDCKGEVQAVMLEKLNRCFDAEHAETMALLKALEWAKEVGLSHFILEGDALCVINKIKRIGRDLSMTGHILDQIRALLREFPIVQLNHVARQF